MYYEDRDRREDIIVDNVIVYEVEEAKQGKKKKPFFKQVALTVVTGLVCGAIGAGSMIGYQEYRAYKVEQEARESLQMVQESLTSEDSMQNTTSSVQLGGQILNTPLSNEATVYDVSAVVRNTMPAVVAINCKGVAVQYDFFGRGYESETSGSGSGIIVSQSDEELLLVTNYHVVDGMTQIEVVFADESKASAKVKGTQSQDDLAVIAVDMDELSTETLKNIRVARIGDSNAVEPGDMAIAIGNALGYGQSVTVGYISAVNREVTIDGVTMTLLQTDAAINPGNSGGALLNIKGELIGINNAKLVSSSIEGIGYAIPISHAVPIINELVTREELDVTKRAYLGITGREVTEELSTALNLPVGIYVNSIEKDSPVEKAGMKPYSVITAVNGKTVATMEELRNVLSYTRGGSTGTITVQELINGVYTEIMYDITFGYQSK